jgi:hypothetical protein
LPRDLALSSFPISSIPVHFSHVDPARRTHLKHLALYGASVLLPPALWRESAPPPPPDEEGKPERIEEHWFTGGKPLFSRTPLNKLIREKPEVIFLGDSMVKAWIDPEKLSALSGQRVSTLWQPNSTSSRWYLMFKNYVVRSQVRPRRASSFSATPSGTSPPTKSMAPSGMTSNAACPG